MVHRYLTSAYYLFNKHPEMIAELEAQRRIIDDIIKAVSYTHLTLPTT